MCDGATDRALPAITTFSDFDHIARSQRFYLFFIYLFYQKTVLIRLS